MIVAFYPNVEDKRSADPQGSGDVLAAVAARCVQCAHALALRLGSMYMKPTGQVERVGVRLARRGSSRTTTPLASRGRPGRAQGSGATVVDADAMLPTSSLELAPALAADRDGDQYARSSRSSRIFPLGVNLHAPAVPAQRDSAASASSSIPSDSPSGSALGGGSSMRLIRVAAGKMWPFRSSASSSKGPSRSVTASASCKLERLRPERGLPQRRPSSTRPDFTTTHSFARNSIDTVSASYWSGYEAARRRVASVSGVSRQLTVSSPPLGQAGTIVRSRPGPPSADTISPAAPLWGLLSSSREAGAGSSADEVSSKEDCCAESRDLGMPGPAEGADGAQHKVKAGWKSKFQSLSVALLAPSRHPPPSPVLLERQLSTTANRIERSRLSCTDQGETNASMPLTLSRHKSSSGARTDAPSHSNSTSLQKNMFQRRATKKQLRLELDVAGASPLQQQQQPRPKTLAAPVMLSLEVDGPNADEDIPWSMLGSLVLGSPTNRSRRTSLDVTSRPSPQDFAVADEELPSIKVGASD